MTREEIVAAARAQLRTPYQHQAALAGVATDCIGLIEIVATALGVPEAKAWAADARRRSYAKHPDADMLLAAAREYLVPVQEPQPGDIGVFRFKRLPQHFAILTGETMIHAYASAGRVVENTIDKAWRRRMVTAFAFRGL